MKVLAATNNGHKVREFTQILTPLGYELVTPKDLGINIDPEENGTTFEENALIKAQAFVKEAGIPVIADDSGLETDFLNGGPGVYSARYAEGSDADRVNKLLDVMKDTENRGARFVSAVAMIFPDGRKICVRGECHGVIAKQPVGENGFGYDPVFFVESFGKTFSELSADEKNSISHRGRALAALEKELRNIKVN